MSFMKSFMLLLAVGLLSATSAETIQGSGSFTRNPSEGAVSLHTGVGRIDERPTTPFALALVTPVELPFFDWDVCGIRFSLLYGRNVHVTGLDLGTFNAVEQNMTGLQLGVVNSVGTARALQIGFMNHASALRGLQIGVINHAQTAYGLQIGLINVIEEAPLPFCPILLGSF